MSWIKKERDEFINEYERKYGVRISEQDEMLPIMHYIYTAGLESVYRHRQMEQLFAKIEKSLNEAVFSSIKIALQDLEALRCLIDIAIRILIFIVVIVGAITIGSVIVNWSSTRRYEADAIIEAAPIFEKELLKRVVNDPKGNTYLQFVPDKGDGYELFKEFQLQEDSSIHVYLDLAR